MTIINTIPSAPSAPFTTLYPEGEDDLFVRSNNGQYEVCTEDWVRNNIGEEQLIVVVLSTHSSVGEADDEIAAMFEQAELAEEAWHRLYLKD